MDKIFWGIIGCGDVTEMKSGPAFNKIPESKLVAVMRRDASKARDYAERHHVAKWYSDAEQLINDPEVNAVYIATPPQFHAQYAIQSMQAGKPVYVEKPMAVQYSDCLMMNKVAAETGVPLLVAYYRRSLPYFIKIKNLLVAQSIGQILGVSIRHYMSPRKPDLDKSTLPWRVNPEIAGGGYFYDMACHTLDILDFMFGPISEVSGLFSNRGGLYHAEDVVSASFKFQNGITASGLWCFTAHENAKNDLVEIIGTQGKIIFSTFEFTPIILVSEKGRKEFLPPNPVHIQENLIGEVVKELREEGCSPSNGISAARTNYVMDVILDKIKHNQEMCS